jgi:hypothetical protein
VIVAALLWYWPTLETRLFEPGRDLKTVAIDDVGVDFSGRDDIWEFYFEEFTFSPLFGRGMGAGFVAAADWVPWRRKTPTTSTVPAGQHRRRRVSPVRRRHVRLVSQPPAGGLGQRPQVPHRAAAGARRLRDHRGHPGVSDRPRAVA